MVSTFGDCSDSDISEPLHYKIIHCILHTFCAFLFFHFQFHCVKVDDGPCESKKNKHCIKLLLIQKIIEKILDPVYF